MECERNPYLEFIMAVFYIFCTFLSYYCVCLRTSVGVKYFVNLVVGGWALLAFFVHPKLSRAKFCGKFYLMFCAPFLLFWLWSLVIWVKDFQTTDYIIRGSKNIFYMFTNVLFLCGAVYLFGEKTPKYTLYGMAAANFAVFFEVGMGNGFGNLISEYVTLLLTFANRTGDVVRKMELHDMVFAWGLYILYYIMHKGDKWWERIIYLGISALFFTLALKRIGVAALILAIAVAFLYERLTKTQKGCQKFTATICIGMIAFALAYIISIRSGLFVELTNMLGITLMGRENIFMAYNDFYTISPTYLGQGIRFIFNHGETTGGIGSIHNVYLELFIELGFAMWVIWLYYDTYFRNRWIEKKFTAPACTFCFAGCIYMFITFMTDNTYFYYGLNVVYRLLAMTWCYEIAVKNGLFANDAEEYKGLV